MHGLNNIKLGKQWVENCTGLRVLLDTAVRREICASARQRSLNFLLSITWYSHCTDWATVALKRGRILVPELERNG